MSDILDEKAADTTVIINLLREIKRLRELHKMGKLLLDVNGDVYFAEIYTLISETDVDNKVDQARKEIAEFEKVNALSDKLKAVSETATEAPAETPAPAPETPVETPVETPAEVVEAPAPTPEPTPAPVEVPTEQVEAEAPVAPEQPQPQIVIN